MRMRSSKAVFQQEDFDLIFFLQNFMKFIIKYFFFVN